jgi:hypothetical protein
VANKGGRTRTQQLTRVIGSLVRPYQVRCHLKAFHCREARCSKPMQHPARNWGKSDPGRCCMFPRHGMASSMRRRALHGMTGTIMAERG